MESSLDFVTKNTSSSRANKPPIIVGEPVTWVIRKATYRMEQSSDGLPIFHHSGFCYKATTAGAGSIAWYIRCTKYSDEEKQCFVQGVRHTDGRLLMLRKHNHPRSQIAKTPKRVLKSAILPASLPSRIQIKSQKVNASPKSLNISLPTCATSPVLVNGKSRGKYPREAKGLRNDTKKNIDKYKNDADNSLLSRMQNRWRAARRKSVLNLRSAVEMVCL